MTMQHTIPSQPGSYRLKAHSLLPWLQVRLVKDSVYSPQTLRLRCAGMTLPVGNWLANGQWEGPLDTP